MVRGSDGKAPFPGHGKEVFCSNEGHIRDIYMRELELCVERMATSFNVPSVLSKGI